MKNIDIMISDKSITKVMIKGKLVGYYSLRWETIRLWNKDFALLYNDADISQVFIPKFFWDLKDNPQAKPRFEPFNVKQ